MRSIDIVSLCIQCQGLYPYAWACSSDIQRTIYYYRNQKPIAGNFFFSFEPEACSVYWRITNREPCTSSIAQCIVSS